jgi:PAS domain S-box-containing protein
LDAIRAAVIAADLTGTIFYCNPAAERLYGYSADQMLGARGPELLARPVDRPRSAAIWARLMAGQPVTHTFPVWCADGSTRPVRVTDSPLWRGDKVIGIIGVHVAAEGADGLPGGGRHPGRGREPEGAVRDVDWAAARVTVDLHRPTPLKDGDLP